MYKLSPSDFKYLWEDCKHCYYRKVKEGINLPSIFPSIFNKMSGMLQKNVQDCNLRDLHPDLPSGKFVKQEIYMESLPCPSGKSYIKGRSDLLAYLDDGTYGVIDLKMVNSKDADLDKFGRQLHAYKYAFEHCKEGEAIKISKLGLLIAEPTDIRPAKGFIYYKVKPVWKEVAIDMDGFFKFVEEVEKLLDGPEPQASHNCKFCAYKHNLIPINQKVFKNEATF